MDCPKCGEEIAESLITCDVAAHDKNTLDINAPCIECGTPFNGFITISEMTEV